jgi:hypothetical protein
LELIFFMFLSRILNINFYYYLYNISQYLYPSTNNDYLADSSLDPAYFPN